MSKNYTVPKVKVIIEQSYRSGKVRPKRDAKPVNEDMEGKEPNHCKDWMGSGYSTFTGNGGGPVLG